MANLLTRKLELFAELAEDDKRLLDDVVAPARTVRARRDLIEEGDTPGHLNLILSGFACRYKRLENGSRQIVAFLLPGDFCDTHAFILKQMDHAIGTLSACTVVKVPRRRILEMLNRPAIARAIWFITLIDEATLREWLVNIGRRPAEVRVGHLLCELHLRLASMGLADGGSCELPLTQNELADSLGLSEVHVNRALQSLRRQKLITLRSRKLVMADAPGLRAFSSFNSNYLHLTKELEEVIHREGGTG